MFATSTHIHTHIHTSILIISASVYEYATDVLRGYT